MLFERYSLRYSIPRLHKFNTAAWKSQDFAKAVGFVIYNDLLGDCMGILSSMFDSVKHIRPHLYCVILYLLVISKENVKKE